MLRKVVFSAFVLLAAACATSTRPPAQTASASSEADAGIDDTDDDTTPETAEGAEATDVHAHADSSPCRADMVLVAPDGSDRDVRFCVDKYEASLVEADADGNEKPYPNYLPVDGHTVRAVSTAGVFPQGFISEVQAEDACAASGKRLCTYVEWKTACMGPSKSTFPYGNARQPGTCNDTGKSAVGTVFGFQRLADPVGTNTPATTKATTTSKSWGCRPNHPAAAASPLCSRSASGKATGKSDRVAHAESARRDLGDGVTGRAAETSRPRATRATAKTDKPSKKGERTARATSKSSSERPRAELPRSKTASRRTPAKASARPASVEPSVWTQLNDPRLGQVEGALARTGSHEECVNGYGVVDIVGNLHEWVKTDPNAPHGTFAGGYYLDTALNGDGCNYRTTAHAHDYHDYSTGFRCCADATPSATTSVTTSL
jgi:hypothetical protein